MAGGVAMMKLTGRARFRQRRSTPESAPLNLRFKGYDAAAAQAYWQWLGPEGRSAEARFLKADMLFPFWYGGLILGSLAFSWASLGRPFSFAVLAAPVVIAVFADWVENVLHLRELRGFAPDAPVSAGRVAVASAATTTKLAFFWISTLLLVGMAGWLLFTEIRGV